MSKEEKADEHPDKDEPHFRPLSEGRFQSVEGSHAPKEWKQAKQESHQLPEGKRQSAKKQESSDHMPICHANNQRQRDGMDGRQTAKGKSDGVQRHPK